MPFDQVDAVDFESSKKLIESGRHVCEPALLHGYFAKDVDQELAHTSIY